MTYGIEKLHALLREPRPLRWLFAGDSITHGCHHTGGMKNFFEYIKQYLSLPLPNGMDRSGDLVMQTGVSSATTGDCLHYYESWVENIHPDIIVFMFGMNDAVTISGLDGTPNGDADITVFRQNLDELMTRFVRLGAFPIAMIPNASCRDEAIAPYEEAVRALCRREGMLLVDHHAMFSGAGKQAEELMSDHIHPNGLGHFYMAKEILRTLGLPETGVLAGPLPYRVAYGGCTEGYVPPLNRFLRIMKPQSWCFLGGGETADISVNPSARGYVAQAEEVLRWEKTGYQPPEPRMRFFVNAAKPNMTLGEIADRLDELLLTKPNLVFLMPENEDESALRAIIAAIKERGAQLVLLPCPARPIAEQERLVQIAKEHGLPYTEPFAAASPLTATVHKRLCDALCRLFDTDGTQRDLASTFR